MHRRRYLFLWVLLLAFCHVSGALAQQSAAANDEILRQIREREELMRVYEKTSAQRNGLFKKKPSKKDLNQVNAALRRIIRKDTEILQAVKQRTLPTIARVEAGRIEAESTAVAATKGRDEVLENQIEEMQIRELQRDKLEQERELRLLVAQAAAAEAEQARTQREMLAMGLALLCAGLLGYILWQRRRQGQRRSVPLQHRTR